VTTPPTLTPAQARRQAWVDRYTAKTDPLLSLLALAYLVTFTVQSIWYQPQETWYTWLLLFGYALWLSFAVDLLVRFAVSPVKRGFVRRNWFDVFTVVIPQFRALRALRAFTPNGILGTGRSVITPGALTTAGIGALLVVWVGSLMVLNAERGAPGADISTFGDSVWWSFETITTVGYGDFVPVTWNGRFFAVLIMLVGISVLGAVTATLSATLVKTHLQKRAAPAPDAPKPADAPDVLTEIRELKQMVAALQLQLGQGPASGQGGQAG